MKIRRDYLVDFEKYDGGNILLGDDRECRVRGTSKIKVIKGSLVVLSGTRRANCVYTLDNQAVTRKTLKGRNRLEEYQTSWKIKKGIQQQNGLVEETNVTLLAKVHCFLIQSGLSKVFWAEDTTMSTYLVNRSPSSAIGFKTLVDMLGFFDWLTSIKQGMLEPVKVKCIFMGYRKGFNESGEYKKTLIGSGVGTGSVYVLQGVEFEDLIYYHTTCDREQHSAWELFNYREDSNETAFAVAVVDKIYAHKSLTFNNTVACKVIFKWKDGLKDGMDARSNVYVLSNGCRKCSDDNNVYCWEYILGIRVGSLSRDCDVEKNGKWSCIHAVRSQEYQMVCMILDIASEDVGMLDKFDHGLQKDAHVFVDFDYAMGRLTTIMGSMTLMEAAKEAIRLKGIAIESGFELKIVAGIATCSLSEDIPGPRFRHRLNLLSIAAARVSTPFRVGLLPLHLYNKEDFTAGVIAVALLSEVPLTKERLQIVRHSDLGIPF
ncbi:zinc finger, CCHC-type containing protein [Tanacetum coccineum]